MFIYSLALFGLHAELVSVETDISPGLRAFHMVGLPDLAVKESKERIRSAIKNTGLVFPRTRVTVNLAPAHLKKQGPAFDLSIALSILLAQGEIPYEAIKKTLFMGELGLHGELRPVSGCLIGAIFAKEKSFQRLIIPKQNFEEASLIKQIQVYPVQTLREMIDDLKGIKPLDFQKPAIRKNKQVVLSSIIDFSDIKGQEHAKRGLEIAAAGSHNIILFGPPGSGKTLLARALPSLLPPLSQEESLEVTKISSITGNFKNTQGLIQNPPFRSPHHSSSATALIGGGAWPEPGEVTMAHRGVLFLDELPEFSRFALEHLRQPLEDGFVSISRTLARVTFPARFLLVAAMNPCPCGYATDPTHHCTCSRHAILKYLRKISGPLLDRIDLCIPVPKVETEKLLKKTLEVASSQFLKSVYGARRIQYKRFRASGHFTNAEMSPKELEMFCLIDDESQKLMKIATEKLSLSARGYTRVLKIARTIADLAQSQSILAHHLSEALTYRPGIEIFTK